MRQLSLYECFKRNEAARKSETSVVCAPIKLTLCVKKRKDSTTNSKKSASVAVQKRCKDTKKSNSTVEVDTDVQIISVRRVINCTDFVDIYPDDERSIGRTQVLTDLLLRLNKQCDANDWRAYATVGADEEEDDVALS